MTIKIMVGDLEIEPETEADLQVVLAALTPTYTCDECGARLPDLVVEHAHRTKKRPAHCGPRCYNTGKKRRYRARLAAKAQAVATAQPTAATTSCSAMAEMTQPANESPKTTTVTSPLMPPCPAV